MKCQIYKQIFVIYNIIKKMLNKLVSSMLILMMGASVKSLVYEYDNEQPKICQGNRFKHISSYHLGHQEDLITTFTKLQPITKVPQVKYSDQLFRTYIIENIKLHFDYMESREAYSFEGVSKVKVFGGTLRITFEFDWVKKQLASQINGTGKGKVTTDSITFTKSLDINQTTKNLEWNYVSAQPITISNSIALNQISPYKEGDYEIINEMLNHLKNTNITVKSNLIKSLNTNFTSTLKQVVHDNHQTYNQSQYLQYSYVDYRGQFTVGYDNYIQDLHLGSQGLDLLLSTVIQDYPQFECGEKVPDQPRDEIAYGGLQQFYSNSFIKYTLKYALKRGFLDIVLSEQNWQSPAFQFFVGDLHQVMPSSKNISSLDSLNGRCKAQDDKSFHFEKKTNASYDVQVNFTCDLNYNKNKILGITILVDYEVGVSLLSDEINFIVQSITGQPIFQQIEGWEIKNMDLALFMVSQTMKMTQKSLVLGSGFRVMTRKRPSWIIEDDYLFMYDSAAKPYNPESLLLY